MLFVKGLRIDTIELPHALGEVAIRCFDDKMIMVVHEAIGMAKPVETIVDFFQDVEKEGTVFIIVKDLIPCIASGGDVIEGAFVFYSKWSCHKWEDSITLKLTQA